MDYFKIYTLLIVGFLLFFNDIDAQVAKESSIEIEELFDKLYYAESDHSKDSVNSLIINKLELYLFERENDFSDLDSIRNLYKISSNDKYVFIFTWAVQYSNHKFKYFGFIKYYSEESRKYYIEKLNHQPQEKDFLNKTVPPDAWYGAVYYSIILKKYKGEKQYILLGWDGNDDFTNKKIIDIIVIEEDEIPVFGKEVFKTESGFKKRMVFEYAERVSMILNYDKNLKMIIWDHLSPSKPELNGHFEYYGPDMTFDGFIFDKGIWTLISDVDISKR